MKLVHNSAYPGITIRQFHRLMGDDAYQNALSIHGKIVRENVTYTPQSNGLESSWDTCVKRSLRQKHLAPLRAVFPQGLEVRWSERHGYDNDKGWLRLKLEKPSIVHAEIEGHELLTMQGDTLMRRIEIDFGKAKLPMGIGFIPGVQQAVAKEVDVGLTRSDECTKTWLQEHSYATPAPSVRGRDEDSDNEVFVDAVD